MTIVKNGAAALAVAALLVGCASKKKVEDSEPRGEPSAKVSNGDHEDLAAAGTTPPDPGQKSALCIDLDDLQMEPLDLEGLQDELAPVDLDQGVGAVLDGLTSHGTPIPVDGGQVVVPAMKCESTGCKAGILVIGASGDDSDQREPKPLPGLDGVDASTELEFVAALADIDSDGKTALWVGYHRRDKKAEPASSTYQVVALSLPAMKLEWHAVVSRSADGDDASGCEGALYPADANCDGRGDLVLVERCGPMRCLGDEGDGNPGCESGQITEKASVYLWDAKGEAYVKSPTAS